MATLTISQLPSASTLSLVDKFPIDNNTSGVITTKSASIAQILALTSIPTASSSIIGGVRVGTGLSIDANGVLSLVGSTYVLPIASASTLGGIKIGNNLSIDINGVLSAQAGGTSTLATTSTAGIVQIGTGINVSGGVISIAYGTSANTAAQGSDSRIVNAASITSPAFNGIPTAPTASVGTNSNQLATTAFVLGQSFVTLANIPTATSTTLGLVKPDGTTITNSSGITSVTYGTGAGTAAQGNDSRITGAAPTASPTFTGTVTIPTVTPGSDNTTKAASTAFVQSAISAISAGVISVVGKNGTVALSDLVAGGVAPIASPTFTGTVTIPAGASISGFATLASPTFTGTPTVPGYLTTTDASTTYAVLASPALTGTPSTPTAATGTNTNQIASTAYVVAGLALKANLASPALTGTPTAPTATTGTNTTQLATTAFVAATVASNTAGVSTVLGKNGDILLSDLTAGGLAPTASPTFTGTVTIPNGASISGYATTASPTFTGTVTIPSGASINGYATLASPTFTGVPLAPTATTGTSNTQLATTAFVAASVAASTSGISSVAGQTGSPTAGTITLANLVTGGVAPLASPTFTGVPLAPTATGGTNTTQLATTAFVSAAVAAATSGISSVAGQTGSPTAGIITLANLVTGGVAPIASPTFTGTVTIPTGASIADYAKIASPTFTGTVTIPAGASISGFALLASPTFTGTPVVPTAANGTNTTQAASTAFVTSSLATFAPLASPTFTGTPTVPGYLTTTLAASTYATKANSTYSGTQNFTGATITAATPTTTDNSTLVATTAYVQANFSNSVTGTLLNGNGTPGIVYTDSSGNASIKNAYRFAPYSITAPVTGQIFADTVPHAVTLTSVTVGALNVTGSTNGFTVDVFVNGTDVAGLTAASATGTSGVVNVVATSPVNVAAGSQIGFQITVNGTFPNTGTAYVQMNGTWG